MPGGALGPLLEGRRSRPDQLVELLQDVQDTCGYISEEAMITASQELGVPLIEVYRVANFYKAFTLAPRGEHVVTVCLGTACHVRGAGRLVDQLTGELGIQPGETTADGHITLECVNCLGACALGPVAIVDGVYHHHVTPKKLKKLLASLEEGAVKGGES